MAATRTAFAAPAPVGHAVGAAGAIAIARAPLGRAPAGLRAPSRRATISAAPAKSTTPLLHTYRSPARMVAGDDALGKAHEPAPEAKLAPITVPSSAVRATLVTGALFGLWYAFNIVFNLMNKQVLNAWSKPLALSTIQLAVGCVMVLFQWTTGLAKRPNLSPKLMKALFLPTLGHLVGHVSTCVSFSYVAVSFAHIVKAAEPAVSAIGSAAFLGDVYSLPVYLALLPIIAGVALSAVTEISFSWPGFLFAMLSNVAFACRNVFSKKNMGEFKDDPTLTPANIYGIMSMMALLVEIPFALALEGIPVLPSARIGKLLLGSGVFYTLYNTVSFMALGRTGVLTHAVGNILKRASVIIVSILFFRNPIKPLNAIGMFVAIAGTALYSFAKRRFAQQQKKIAKNA
jgi:solute carrier family 35, member E1